MKKFIILAFLLLFAFPGCKKESFEDIPTPTETKKDYLISFETPEQLATWFNDHLGREEFRPSMFVGLFERKSKPLCYDSVDLLAFLAEYGESPRDIIPAVPNSEFQDAFCFTAFWEASVHERDPINGTANNSSVQPVEVIWEIDEDPAVNTGIELSLPLFTYNLVNCDTIWATDPDTGEQIVEEIINCESIINTDCPGIFQPSCDGVHICTITMIFEDGSVYQRTGTVRGEVNNLPEEIAPCELGLVDYDQISLSTFDFDCFCPIVFEPYEFMVNSGLEWDLDGDGAVAIQDLLLLLANYGC